MSPKSHSIEIPALLINLLNASCSGVREGPVNGLWRFALKRKQGPHIGRGVDQSVIWNGHPTLAASHILPTSHFHVVNTQLIIQVRNKSIYCNNTIQFNERTFFCPLLSTSWQTPGQHTGRTVPSTKPQQFSSATPFQWSAFVSDSHDWLKLVSKWPCCMKIKSKHFV